MKKVKPKTSAHMSASSSHYDKEAASYDAFNEERSQVINKFIESVCKGHGVKTVLDVTCGTGSQVFWLAKRGYEVTGYDISEKMISIARQKAEKEELDVVFGVADMCTVQAGQFDAVLSIFNAVGHLTKDDFETAMKNIHTNLNPGGLYLFDIFNLDYLRADDNITKLTIDWLKREDDVVMREIQYSTISTDGVLASHDIYHRQEGDGEPEISTAFQTLQVYSAQQLREMLERNGFDVVKVYNVDGSSFDEIKSERMMLVACKK